MSAWFALVLVDAFAVASFARCFSGPGELTAALSTLAAVHLACLAARHHPGRRRAYLALGIATAVLLPVAIELGTRLFAAPFGLGAWHALAHDLRTGWRAFYFEIAPVPELPGLVLVVAWASGILGLLAELISSTRRLPAAVSLVPAVGLYLFASALGTGSWRVVTLAGMAGTACWYLVAATAERGAGHAAVLAVPDTDPSARRGVSGRAGAVVLRMAVLAALAAAVVGPNLPGARSSALVAWRGLGGTKPGPSTTVVPSDTLLPGGVEVSTLVQVGKEEIDDASVPLFEVHTSVPTRELVAALDVFNGSSWSTPPTLSHDALGTFPASLGADESAPPSPRPIGTGRARLVQVFDVADLGGDKLPASGVPLGVDGALGGVREGAGGALVTGRPLRQGWRYAVSSVVADPSPSQLEVAATDNSDPRYMQLPSPVPARLVSLAHGLVSKAATPFDKALALETYLRSPQFRYQLTVQPVSTSVPARSRYGDLLEFLFGTRTGYCQQFATAFAVLARIDGLPTRVAVGFLPGAEAGHDTWQVDGDDTHAWPQVLFDRYGWINFEPTPGATDVGSPGAAVSTPGTSIATSSSTTLVPVQSTVPRASGGSSGPNTYKPGEPGSSFPLTPWLVLPLAVVAWAGVVLFSRLERRRRAFREPRGGVLSAWAEASRILGLAGVVRRRGETHLELAGRVASSGVLSAEAEAAFFDLARLVETACYAASAPGPSGARQAFADAEAVVRSARRKLARWQLVMTMLDPRGLVA